MSVLLLNASMQPIRVISKYRAVVLVWQGHAELLESTGEVLRSPSAELDVPAVIRLNHMVKIPFKTSIPFSRKGVNVRDGHACQVKGCQKRGTTIDHLLPRSRGGDTSWANCVLMCVRHNTVKRDRTMEESGWELKNDPLVPRAAVALLASAGVAEPNPKWQPYLAYSW